MIGLGFGAVAVTRIGGGITGETKARAGGGVKFKISEFLCNAAKIGVLARARPKGALD